MKVVIGIGVIVLRLMGVVILASCAVLLLALVPVVNVMERVYWKIWWPLCR